MDTVVKKAKALMSGIKKGSWRTTAAGLLTGLASLAIQASYFLDDNPLTVVNFNEVWIAIGVISVGLSARDNSVSSEQAGVK